MGAEQYHSRLNAFYSWEKFCCRENRLASRRESYVISLRITQLLLPRSCHNAGDSYGAKCIHVDGYRPGHLRKIAIKWAGNLGIDAR
jgi:hypothetical protein